MDWLLQVYGWRGRGKMNPPSFLFLVIEVLEIA
jgi:hypothetical protein